MTWLSHAWPQVLDLTRAHLLLSVLAVLASLLIAIPVGYAAARLPRVGAVLSTAATLVYAIPALPLLILIPVLFGVPLRSTSTIAIALTCYGAALMVRTAADAFSAVDPDVRRAAEAVGHSRWSLCWHVDLPLATPLLIASARVVCVSTVGLVTIGALIGVPSLGSLFTDGFQRGILPEVATGIIGTVLVGLLLDGACALVGRALTRWDRAWSDPRERPRTAAAA
ncbi:ABC transporter permease (plasmid) [Cellulomonas sp. WB94]|uniref:ABC transporter permease n=1 Tax=Cellulomonas sp. WB94 TaxID=2173174 RepID=UPI000D586A04|nr:ABC transporter permease subunit [Cellulomonas sp. WB94]PVU84397.1 ABC transporter permease [Cellulomonas sp. WB94]